MYCICYYHVLLVNTTSCKASAPSPPLHDEPDAKTPAKSSAQCRAHQDVGFLGHELDGRGGCWYASPPKLEWQSRREKIECVLMPGAQSSGERPKMSPWLGRLPPRSRVEAVNTPRDTRREAAKLHNGMARGVASPRRVRRWYRAKNTASGVRAWSTVSDARQTPRSVVRTT